MWLKTLFFLLSSLLTTTMKNRPSSSSSSSEDAVQDGALEHWQEQAHFDPVCIHPSTLSPRQRDTLYSRGTLCRSDLTSRIAYKDWIKGSAW